MVVVKKPKPEDTGNKDKPPASDEERRKNIERAIAKVRASSPSGTLGGGATGRSGVAGSYQATGGGTTVIAVGDTTGTSFTGKKVVPYSSVKRVKGESSLSAPSTGVSTGVTSIPYSKYEQMADYPYGKIQRKSVSQLKREQAYYALSPEQRADILREGLKSTYDVYAEKKAYEAYNKRATKALDVIGAVKLTEERKKLKEIAAPIMPVISKLKIRGERTISELKKRGEEIKRIPYATEVISGVGKGVKYPFWDFPSQVLAVPTKPTAKFLEEVAGKQKVGFKLLEGKTSNVHFKKWLARGADISEIEKRGFRYFKKYPEKLYKYSIVGATVGQISPSTWQTTGGQLISSLGKGALVGYAGMTAAEAYLKKDVGLIGERGAPIAALIGGRMLGGKIAAIEAEKYAPKQIIEAKINEGITAKEKNFIKSISEETSQETLKWQEELGYDTDKYVSVDINRLGRNPKLMEKFIQLQNLGKIETAFEFVTGVEEQKVGFTIEPRRGISATEQQARLTASEKLSQLLEAGKQKAFMEQTTGEETARAREMSYEQDVRKIMRVKGVTAKEALAEIKAGEEELVEEWKPIIIKDTGKITDSIDKTDPFKNMGKALKDINRWGGLSGDRQEYVLVEETEYLRGMRPVSSEMKIDISGIKEYTSWKGIAEGGKLSPAFLTLPFQMPMQKLLGKTDIKAITQTKPITVQKPSIAQQLKAFLSLDTIALTKTLPKITTKTITQPKQASDVIADIISIPESMTKTIPKVIFPPLPSSDEGLLELPKFKLPSKSKYLFKPLKTKSFGVINPIKNIMKPSKKISQLI